MNEDGDDVEVEVEVEVDDDAPKGESDGEVADDADKNKAEASPAVLPTAAAAPAGDEITKNLGGGFKEDHVAQIGEKVEDAEALASIKQELGMLKGSDSES